MSFVLEIIHDGTKERIKGRDLIDQQKTRNIVFPDLDTHLALFASNDPILEKWKGEPNGEIIFIFCIETLFPTPHGDGKDLCVRYFLWSHTAHFWYSTYWRIDDETKWNVLISVLVPDDLHT